MSEVDDALAGAHEYIDELRAAIERVRELCADPWGSEGETPGLVVRVADVLAALDGNPDT